MTSGEPHREPSRPGLALVLGGAAAVAVALRLRVLRLPFILDDFLQLAMNEGEGWIARPPWDRSRLISGWYEEARALMADGRLPWWTDPDLRIAPFRPLSGLEGALGYALHGPNPVPAHAVSLLWLAALVSAVGLLLSAVLPRRAAVIAILAYALSRAHGTTVAWIANRCALIAVTFAALAIYGHVRWREGGRRAFQGMSLLCLCAALLSAEYALGAFGFLLAYELLERRETFAERARALAGPLGIGVVYLLLFRLLEYGSRATTLYIDPLASPVAFARRAAANVVALLELAFAPVPPWGPARASAAIGIACAALFAGALFTGKRDGARRKAWWLLLGGLLALVPVASTWPQVRLLAAPEIGVAAGLGAIVSDAISSPGVVHRALAFVLAVVHLVLAPLATDRDLADLGIHHFFRLSALTAPVPTDPDTDVVLLESTQVFAMHYPPLVRRLERLSVPRTWRVLSCTPGPVEVRRTGPAELELRSLGQGLLDDAQAGVYRDPRATIAARAVFSPGDLRVTILETGPLGPTRARFELARSLDDPRLVLLVAGPRGFVRISPPALGATIVIPGG